MSGLNDRAGAVFAALADPTRREIARLLADRGPLTPTELAKTLPITRQGVAKHLLALEEAGLVRSARHGRETRYRLTPRPFEAAALWMAALGAGWDERLDSLRRLLERR
jgi:ArsR family transcriptional regulator, cadmium/lead-responsive transcriptional repressor